ncbi:phage holin family protein [Timonella senegalensis]|uniref:phage holin family protein n=1 Tax=Timonella senegalensis TaxID=1465825 RepID=UPI0028A7EAE9|nr:phage holin family protein [Timonella senegalensis]
MVRFLLNICVSLLSAVIAFFVAKLVVDGFTINGKGFIIAVAVFTVAQAILGPFVFNIARKYASAILGGIGLVSTLLALWIATLFPGGITINGTTSWIASTLVVWIVSALGIWILGALIIKKWWGTKQEDKERLRALARQNKRNGGAEA